MRIKIRVDLTAAEYRYIIEIVNKREDFIKKNHKLHFLTNDGRVLRYYYDYRRDTLYIENADKELIEGIKNYIGEYNAFTLFFYKNGKKTKRKNGKNSKKK